MNFNTLKKNPIFPFILSILSGCTEQLPGSFRLQQQTETFSSKQEVNTQIDLLWVVDNSASMDVSQEKLRKGFQSFAERYLQPTWDIRVAVITTDTYLANSAFQSWISQTIPGTVGWQSSYITSKQQAFQNPDWSRWPSGLSARNSQLLNPSSNRFESGIRYGELIPAWGPNWSRLLSGLHDGPTPALCNELLPHFLNGIAQCPVRDEASNDGNNRSVASCLEPDENAGESGTSQCVNTLQNDSVRSGRPILSTLAEDGSLTDQNWRTQLIRDFKINVSTGTTGQGSERGLGSVLQLLADNESSETAFFRKNSLRGIIFVSDEDDQTFDLAEAVTEGFSPRTGYLCDEASLLALNGGNPVINGNGGICCSDPAKGCVYGSRGTSCESKTVDGFTYTLSVCTDPTALKPVADIKNEIDQFFLNLDEVTDANTQPNWFSVAIVPLTGASIQNLQDARSHEDMAAGSIHTFAVDRGDRYLELGNLVQNGSLGLDIGEEDYAPVLDSIGRSIIEKKSTFTLERAPTTEEDMIVSVLHENGTESIISAEEYEVREKDLVITSEERVLSLARGDRISINYQPKTLF